jgi:hypothetical protein
MAEGRGHLPPSEPARLIGVNECNEGYAEARAPVCESDAPLLYRSEAFLCVQVAAARWCRLHADVRRHQRLSRNSAPQGSRGVDR